MLLLRLLSAEDCGTYLICSLMGYVANLLLMPAAWAPYAAILVTYHVFLVCRIYFSDKDTARSHSLLATLAAHAGFVVLVGVIRFGLVAWLKSYLGSLTVEEAALESRVWLNLIHWFMVLATYGIVALERRILFRGVTDAAREVTAELEPLLVETYAKVPRDRAELLPATGRDHNEWTQYCARRKSAFYDPRKSPREDFEQWLRARGKTQYPVPGSHSSAAFN